MFLPVILDPFSFHDMRYHWTYLKYLYHCHKENWPIVGQERLQDPALQVPRTFVCRPAFTEKHGYRLLAASEREQVQQYTIPDKLIDDLIQEKGSRLGAKLFLLRERYQPLEDLLESFFEDIESKNSEPIEGIFNWAAHTASVKAVAERRGIPILTNEYCLRFDNYRTNVYLSFGDIYNPDSFRQGFEQFRQYPPALSFPMFNRKELLALFLTQSSVKFLASYNAKPTYEMGMAGCHSFITTFMDKSFYTDLELSVDLRKEYAEKDLLFRMHPGEEPFHATYNFQNLDRSPNAIGFLQKCKRIAAIGSNVVLEAMLWGKPVYTNRVSPFADFCSQDYADKDAQPADDLVLNYALLAFLAPVELMLDPEYLRWRLTKPEPYEIYERHLNFYLEQDHIPDAVLHSDPQNRLQQILISRGLSRGWVGEPKAEAQDADGKNCQ